MKQTIAKRLRELRGNKRQKEVAAALGIKLKAYQAYEECRSTPPVIILQKIKEYYKLKSIDDLITVSN